MSRRSGSRSLLRSVLVVLGWGVLVSASSAADHRDAPLILGNERQDINDVYVFQSPDNRDNTVLVMTVNPFAGIMNPFTLDPDTAYEFLIDQDGDAREDVVLQLTFGEPDEDGLQRVTLRGNLDRGRARGGDQDKGSKGKQGGDGADLSSGVLAQGWTERNIPIRGGGRLRVALHDDPFFFDLNGFNNGLEFTGDDTFAGANITALILEFPSKRLDARHIAVWARTVVDGIQVDRMGRPAINTVLIPLSLKDAFNAGFPENDRRDFGDVVAGTLVSLGNGAETAAALTEALLPDVNTFDTRSAGGFLNGRRLEDDVIDAELNLLVPHDPDEPLTDGVDANDKQFSNRFPYLAAPHDLP